MPGLLATPNLGIALSGGGMRAASLGLGWLRGLAALNATRAARYLASNSGGSWLNAAWSFQDAIAPDVFLGPFVPPTGLSLAALAALARSAPPGPLRESLPTRGWPSPAPQARATAGPAAVAAPGRRPAAGRGTPPPLAPHAGAILDAARSLARGEQQGVGAWSAAVGAAFLAPYGLNADAATFTAAGTAGPVHQALRGLPPGVAVYTYRPDGGAGNASTSGAAAVRPFPIILGAILRADRPLGFYPFECAARPAFTPLYVGVPPFYNDTDPPLGGGFTDPAGLNSAPPAPAPPLPAPIAAAFAAAAAAGADNGTLLAANASAANNASAATAAAALNALLPLSATVQPDFLVPLKMVAGISSSFTTNALKPGGKLGRELTGTEVLRYWSPIAFAGGEVPFADGGSADNLAVTPLLRRRVANIIACVAASQNISGADAADWGGYQLDVSGLFGAAPASHRDYDKDGTIVGTPVDLFNRKLQVFPTEAYGELFAGLQRTTAAGGPTHHLATYTVLPNAHQAVPGGWQVTVLWVVNQQAAAWEAALPRDTADELARSRNASDPSQGGLLGGVVQGVSEALGKASSGGAAGRPDRLGLSQFPFTPTVRADYSPTLTELLGQQATWQALAPQVEELLRRANATGEQRT
ncbi:hypothetical protein HT031_001126 [Scenedesmus sp. PABB004]|nr:hypothetical protein HT031_001126 [Scenedesmus sp. PABB004]